MDGTAQKLMAERGDECEGAASTLAPFWLQNARRPRGMQTRLVKARGWGGVRLAGREGDAMTLSHDWGMERWRDSHAGVNSHGWQPYVEMGDRGGRNKTSHQSDPSVILLTCRVILAAREGRLMVSKMLEGGG